MPNRAPHNGKSALVNCRGLGTCGTCAVEVRGAINPMSVRERLRLTAPPHDLRDGLRLACFVEVQGYLGRQARRLLGTRSPQISGERIASLSTIPPHSVRRPAHPRVAS